MSNDDLSDVEAVLRGDVDRFEGIVTRWEKPLVNLAWRFVRSEAVAEEMAQDAFVACYRKLGQWRREGEFSTWLFAVAMNVYRSHLRRSRLPIDDDAQLETLVAPASTDDLREEQQRGEIVRRAVTFLPPKYREAIVLYHFEERDIPATARILGVAEGTLKARLHRGRRLLKERLETLLR